MGGSCVYQVTMPWMMSKLDKWVWGCGTVILAPGGTSMQAAATLGPGYTMSSRSARAE